MNEEAPAEIAPEIAAPAEVPAPPVIEGEVPADPAPAEKQELVEILAPEPAPAEVPASPENLAWLSFGARLDTLERRVFALEQAVGRAL